MSTFNSTIINPIYTTIWATVRTTNN
jgi:hypothetical protein